MRKNVSPSLPGTTKEQIAEIRRKLTGHFDKRGEYLEHPVISLTKEDMIDNIERQIYRVRIDEMYEAPVCVLAPPGDTRHPVVLVFHGGDGGLDVCCGPGLGRLGANHYHHDMSLELTKAGFLTVTISIRGMGREAQDWGLGDCGKIKETLDDFVGYWIFRGSCAMSVWTYDAIAILNAFIGDPRFDTERIAVSGISTGGEIALYLGALDERIRVICSHGALVSYEDIYTIAHNWAIHAIPGAIGSFDMGDAGIACCPRPIQIQAGENEPEFWGRMRGSTLSEYTRIEQVYKSCGATSQLHITPGGGHAFDSPAAIEFLNGHLRSS